MSEDSNLSKRSIFTFSVFASALLLAGISWAILQKEIKPSVRAIEFTEKISVPVPKEAKNVQIWIPIPLNNFYQHTEILSVESPYSYRITEDKEFRNQLLYFKPKTFPKDQSIEIKVLYNIVRKEQRAWNISQNGNTSDIQTNLSIRSFLEPRGLEVINEKIRKISKETTSGIDDPMKKAKALYYYVLRTMQYDKSGTGWGRGDSVYTCDIGKGNCTDFHSLFITLARASQIPARFQMGIPLPESSEGEPTGSYHCWAEFYIGGKGWIPVDISEAWKNSQKADYFFGNLDVNRILLSTGREILLSPQQKANPLNYLARPYVEVDGKPLTDFKVERNYKNLSPKGLIGDLKGEKRT
ncbi:MAG: transglutaminase domain-containing protein [Elusimicrobia bacterium]|nr:transglutaminase domain-containing protein [Elusimicrobiota bacterium]